MTSTDETRIISSHALTVDGISQPQIQPLNIPTGFNGYRKDAVEQYVNGLETQIWNLQRQLSDMNKLLDSRQAEIGRKEETVNTLRQEISNKDSQLEELRQAKANPIQEWGKDLGAQIQSINDTYEAKMKAKLEQTGKQAADIVEKAKKQAETVINSAKATADDLNKAAQSRDQNSKKEAEQRKQDALEQAEHIVEQAKQKADAKLAATEQEISEKLTQAKQQAAKLDAESHDRMIEADKREREAKHNVDDSVTQLRTLANKINGILA